MRGRLLEVLGEVPLIYNILLLIKYRKDEEFMRQIKGLRKNPWLIEVQETKKDLEKGQALCEINIEGNDAGFFALVRWVLDAMYFCDRLSLKPYIKFSKNFLYYDETMPEDMNPYEYYFEQPCNFDKDMYENVGLIVKYLPRNRQMAEVLNGNSPYQATEEYINQMGRIMRKYLRFNEKTQKIINDQLKTTGANKEMLGVHIRGTDYKLNWKDHPQYVPPEVYYKYIDMAIKKFDFKKIYIATDDQDILREFIAHYGKDKVVFSQNSIRTNGTEGVHILSGVKRMNHKYLLGVEVICDMCMLAACGGLISGLSQVSLASRIYKKSKREAFLYDKKIDRGVNKKGKMFSIVKSASY